MKKLILATVALMTLATSFSAKAGMERIARIASLSTDLHFCVTMSQGVKYTASQDAQILSLLGCDDVVEKLKNLGESEEDILATVERAQTVVALDEIERCADQMIVGDRESCAKEVQAAKDLGLTKEDIQEELGVLAHFITIK